MLAAQNLGSCLAHLAGPFYDLTDPMVDNQGLEKLFECPAFPVKLYCEIVPAFCCVCFCEACLCRNPEKIGLCWYHLRHCVRGDPSSQLDRELELVGYHVGYLVDPLNISRR